MEYKLIFLSMANSPEFTLNNFQHEQFYFVVSGSKIIVHGNPENNLEMTVYISALKYTRLILFILDM
jgi:hypothetical protein